MKMRKGKKKGRKMSLLFPVILIKAKTFNIKKTITWVRIQL